MAFCLTGCTRTVSIPAWQKNVEKYVDAQGGDPLVLRDVTLPEQDNPAGRRGFAMIGGDHPNESTDAAGLLLGHRQVGSRRWFVYLVGLIEREQVKDLRLAAFSADDGQRVWRISPKNTQALKKYRDHAEQLWRQRFPGRDKPPPAYTMFPRPDDRFDLSVSGHHVVVTHPPSGAHWELDLPAPSRVAVAATDLLYPGRERP